MAKKPGGRVMSLDILNKAKAVLKTLDPAKYGVDETDLNIGNLEYRAKCWLCPILHSEHGTIGHIEFDRFGNFVSCPNLGVMLEASQHRRRKRFNKW